MSSPPDSQNQTAAVISTGWLCALVAAWILPGLTGHDPWKPDEAYTFGVIYSMLKSGDFIVPMLAQEPFMEKPPLFYISATLVATLLAPPFSLHDAARLTAGLYMALTFAFVAASARELYGKRHGTLAVLALMGCFGLLVRAHQLITDISLLSGFAAALYGCALGVRRPMAGGFWLGTGVGIGFLSKGLIAPGMVGITVLLLLLFPAWRNRNYLLLLAIAAAAVLPWLLLWPWALHARSPELFAEWLWVNNFGRFLGHNDLGPTADRWHYFRLLPWYALPALPLAAWVVWRSRRSEWLTPPVALPLTVFAVFLAVLSISADAREVYALPMLLPLAVLAAPATDTLRRGAANLVYWFSIMGGCFFVVVAWFYWIALELAIPPKLHVHLHTMQPGYAPGFKWLPFSLGVFYTLGWAVLLMWLGRSRERPLVAWAATVTMIWGLLATLFTGWLDPGKSYRGMIASMQTALPAQYRCISSTNLGEPVRAMLHYFADTITYRDGVEGRRRDCDLLLVQGDGKVELLPSGPWRKIWEGNRPGDNVERFRLYQRTSPK